MSTEAVWIPAVLAAAGAGASAYSAHDTARRQDRDAAAGIRTQATRQSQADARINSQLDSLSKSSPEASRAQALDAFTQQLRRTRGDATGAGVAGASSGRYGTDIAAANEDVAGLGKTQAGVMARIGAPGLQRTAEGQAFARTGQDISGIARQASGDDFLNQLRARGDVASPWINAGGQILAGAGQGMAANGWGSDPAPKLQPFTPTIAKRY